MRKSLTRSLTLVMSAALLMPAVSLVDSQSAIASTACTTSLSANPDSWGNSPRPISTKDELVYLSLNQTGNLTEDYILTTTISLGGCVFTPIGTNDVDGQRFLGVFDGNSKSVTGLNVTSTSRYLGLFGVVGDGSDTVVGAKNLTVEGSVDATLDTQSDSANRVRQGGVVGYARAHTLLQNIVSRVTVTASPNTGEVRAGGVVGQSDGIVENSAATGTISAASTSSGSELGGLVGRIAGTIRHSTASGNVSAYGSVGGLVGRGDRGTIEDSTATGNVTGTEEIGGLVGRSSSSVITRSSASGIVTASGDEAGGLVGLDSGSTIEESTATGNVTGARDVGGLIGDKFAGTITGSHASGTVTASSTSAGGLVGAVTDTEIFQSSASGSVTGVERVGGLAGWVSYFNGPAMSISASFASGNVSGNIYAGGLVGLAADSRILVENSYATGNVQGVSGPSAPQDLGGLVGGNELTLTKTYALGTVTGSIDDVGGILGERNTVTSTTSFWDVANVLARTPDTGVPKSEGELKTRSTFSDAGWDIVDGWAEWAPTATPPRIWGICPLANQGYPFLLWQYESTPCLATSTPGGNAATRQLTEERADAPAIHLDLQASLGQRISGASVVIGGQGLAGGSAYTLTVRSTPQVIDQGTASALGNFSKQVMMPSLAPGSHTLTLSAVAPDGSTLTLVQGFTVGSDGAVTAVGSAAGSSGVGLAATGSDRDAMLWSGGLALLMVLSGLLALHTSRLRHRHR